MRERSAKRTFRILGVLSIAAAATAACSYYFNYPAVGNIFKDRSTAGWVAAVLAACGIGLLFLWRWAAIAFAVPFAIVSISTMVDLATHFTFPESLFQAVIAAGCLVPAVLIWRGWSVLRTFIRFEVTPQPPPNSG
jgi:hypothetical protein